MKRAHAFREKDPMTVMTTSALDCSFCTHHALSFASKKET